MDTDNYQKDTSGNNSAQSQYPTPITHPIPTHLTHTTQTQ